MPELVMTYGLPASGKSTWAIEKVVTQKYVRINKDDLRKMLHNSKWSKENEKLILKIRNYIVFELMLEGKDIIIDDTNLSPKHKHTLENLVAIFNKQMMKERPETKPYIFRVMDFTHVSLEECLKRDSKRANWVGEKVIKDMYNEYLKPQVEKIKQDATLPKAIICDLDGTLAIHNGRTPFEYDKCDTDLVNQTILNIVQNYNETHHIIFVSGREAHCMDKTKDWLIDKCKLQDFDLHMRAIGDFRKDSIIKKEIFDNNIKSCYNVEFVLDDRNSVVDMWRDIGLTCLQVNEGNF